MSEVKDTLKEGAFTRITPRAMFALSPGYTHFPSEVRVCDCDFVLGMEVGCDHIDPKLRDRNRESEATQG